MESKGQQVKMYEGTEPYIFISYSHDDKEQILSILAAMQNRGYRIWFDEDINCGDIWQKTIAVHISRCSVFLLFLSASYLASSHCMDEFHHARKSGGCKIVPIMLTKLDESHFSEEEQFYINQIKQHQGLPLYSKFKNEVGFVDYLQYEEVFQKCRHEAMQSINIEQFVAEQENRLHSLENDVSNSDSILIKKNLSRLQEIQKLLSIPKFRLVFIGNPGSGKTTTICHYLNLLDDNILGKSLGSIELFNVGTGRTTAFEVHYRTGNRTEFRLYPKDQAELEMLIRDYCKYEWGQAFPDSSKSEEKEVSNEFIGEHERIIRNMLGFKSSRRISETLKRDYSQKEFAVFLADMMQKAGLPNRNVTFLCYDGTVSAKDWIKRTFDNINNGKIKNVSIPERVDIYFNPQDITINLPNLISEVIDTRGFEGNDRDDLKKYLDADDTLPVIIDWPEDVPGANQRKILSNWILEEQRDLIQRISLYVNIRDNALARVTGANNKAKTGEEIKRREISRVIQANNLNFNVDNTLFIDPFRGITTVKEYEDDESETTSIIGIKENVRLRNQEMITEHINSVVDRFHKALESEAADIEDITEKLITDITNAKDNQYIEFTTNAAQSLKELVESLIGSDFDGQIDRKLTNFNGRFCSDFRHLWDIRWNSARKTTFLNGTWYNAHLYSQFSGFVRDLSNAILKPAKKEVIKLLKPSDDCFQTLRWRMDSLRRDVNHGYPELIKRIEKNAYHIMVDAFTVTIEGSELDYDSDYSIRSHGDEYYWDNLQNTIGGTGYYDRLMDAFREIMDEQNVAVHIADMVKEETSNFFSCILKELN